MDIPKIEETGQAVGDKEIRSRNAGCQSCIYYPEVRCSIPQMQFKICRSCPRCCQGLRTNPVRSIFDHIKSFAISLLKNMDIQSSK
jgi:hypothetical protein